ncbi:MAG: Uma2 family endonuclease [Synechococcales cyanobacterium CRU_2_2]|nr:Uma2 family endonuclease [Synechococcales cyanobacterium CRU_2_2]
MVALSDRTYLTPDQYLTLETQSDVKHEYYDGEIFAMAGATDSHVTVAGNIFAMMLTHLRGSGCRVYISDMKARIERRDRFFYPDVMVTCESKDAETPLYKSFPKLIIEVLSDSTEAYDRGDKFADYQTLDSLEEYVLISTKRSRIECFRRGEAGLWILHTFVEGQFSLASVGFEGAVEAVYESVMFPAAEEPSET